MVTASTETTPSATRGGHARDIPSGLPERSRAGDEDFLSRLSAPEYFAR
jgi:hypothetical protein